MTLSHETRLEDIVESAVRRYRRTAAYTKNRWLGALISAAFFALFGFLGFHSRDTFSVAGICVAAACWGAGVFLIAYTRSIRKRIAHYVTSEMSHKLPATSRYELTRDALLQTTLGVTSAFPLSEFDSVHEDDAYVEFRFREQGPCVIPRRAFPSAAEHAAFVAAVRRQP